LSFMIPMRPFIGQALYLPGRRHETVLLSGLAYWYFSALNL